MDYFIDTNIFLRYFLADEKIAYKQIVSVFRMGEQGLIKLFTSSLVIAECVWILKSYYKSEREHLIKVVKAINSLSGLKIVDEVDINEANRLYEAFNVKYVDCLITSQLKVKNCTRTVVSYDKDFDKLGVLRVEPGKLAS